MVAAILRRAFPWQVAIVFFPVFILLGVSAWVSQSSWNKAYELSSWVQHTNHVIRELRGLYGALHEGESIHRAYVLTGDSSRLDRFDPLISDFEDHLKSATALTADNPVQRERIAGLTPVARARVEVMRSIIELRHKFPAQAQSVFAQNRGGVLMDEVRERLEVIESEEDRLLSDRTNWERAEAEKARKFGMFTTLIGFLALIVGAVILGRATVQRVRALEESTEAREMALKALAARSLFLANMSHEIRTPLHSIIGMAEVLSDRPDEIESDRGLSIIRRAGNLLMNLINDILDLSKIEAGKLDIEKTVFDLPSLIDETTAMISFRASQKGLELNTEIRPEAKNHVLGDPNRIRQVLLNLLGNAIKFTPKGSVTLTVGKNEEGDVFFEVADTGIGIARDQHDQIFQKFNQIEPATSRSYGGTGLGLTISKQLVELMGGKITFSSEAGVGSTFCVELPLETRPAPSSQKENGWRNDLRRLKVLIVDDVEDNRLIAQLYLKHLPYRLDFAQNGLEALEKVASFKPDLVVMDMHMPKMTGYEAVVELRRREVVEGLPPMPIIALTASALREDAERSFASGCDAHLTKPITREKLQRAIIEATGKVGEAKQSSPAEMGETIYLKRALEPLIASFQTNTVKNLENLIVAARDQNYAEAVDLAHIVKGVSGTFGFKVLSNLASEMERSAKERAGEKLEAQGSEALTYFKNTTIVYI